MTVEEVVGSGNIRLLGQEVIDNIGMPKDEWEIAAQLEVLGMRDVDARRDFGKRDLFDLARQIYRDFSNGMLQYRVEGEDPQPEVSPIFRFLKHYVTGLTFSLPMALQAAAMVVWGYGIWGAMDLDLRTGTAIALGFIASYVLSGGFTQAIVRRGLFYIYQNELLLARWTALRGWWMSLRIMLLLIVPAVVLNALFGVLPWKIVATALGYYAALSILWLNWSLLYLVRKSYLFLSVTAFALACVLFTAKVLGGGPLMANAVGLAVADLSSFLLASFYLNRMARGATEAVNPPRIAVLVYSTSRFFLYGLLYNSFLFADRVIAWTTPVGREDFPPYGFWLSVRYELGMDLALVVVMLTSGVVEHAIQRFSERLIPQEKKVASADTKNFAKEEASRFRNRAVITAVAAILSVAAAYGVARLLERLPNDEFREALLSTTTVRVFWCAAVSYVMFMIGLQSILLLLTLSRVELAVRAIALGLVANVAVGFICSRAIHYSAAVIGLLVGSIVLTFIASLSARDVLRRLDYYYYAAY